MKVYMTDTIVLNKDELPNEIQKLKNIASTLSDSYAFDYLERMEIHEKLNEKIQWIENMYYGIEKTEIEDSFKLILKDGYKTFSFVDGVKDIHSVGEYKTKKEMFEALKNIYLVSKY